MPLLELNGFKAWITCKGRKVEQFSVDYDHDNNTVSCWIPGIVQSEFIVHWRCMNPEHASSGKFNAFVLLIPSSTVRQ